MTEFEASSRGRNPLQQARVLRRACGYVRVLLATGKRWPDEESFLAWLDRELARCRLSTVLLAVPGVERFCRFLAETRGVPNPVRTWRQRQAGLRDALRRRQLGLPPRLRPPRLRSCLAPRVEEYVRFKRALGRRFPSVGVLERLDRFLHERSVERVIDLSPALLLEFVREVLAGQAPSTRCESCRMLRRFFRFLVRRGDFSEESDPARVLPRLRRPPRRPFLFRIGELAAVLEQIRGGPMRSAFNRRLYFTVVHLVYACGLRRCEPLRLRVGDVDLEGRTLRIRGTKFGKDRQVPFGRRAGEYLAEYHRARTERLGPAGSDAPFFVQANGQPPHPTTLGDVFREACRRAGVQRDGLRPRLHDLRHCFAVHRLHKWHLEGADPQQKLVLLSLYMGHVNLTSTQHYLQLSQDLLRVAGRPLERSLEGLGPDDEP